MEIAQIFLLDDNLNVLFSQQRSNIKTFFDDFCKLISTSLHNNYSHIVTLRILFIVLMCFLDSFDWRWQGPLGFQTTFIFPKNNFSSNRNINRFTKRFDKIERLVGRLRRYNIGVLFYNRYTGLD